PPTPKRSSSGGSSALPDHMNGLLSRPAKRAIKAKGRGPFPPTNLKPDMGHFPDSTNEQILAKARSLGWNKKTLKPFVNAKFNDLYRAMQGRSSNRSTTGNSTLSMDLEVGDLNPDIAARMDKFRRIP